MHSLYWGQAFAIVFLRFIQLVLPFIPGEKIPFLPSKIVERQKGARVL